MGGSGGTIIVGDKDIVTQLKAHTSKVAQFRLQRMTQVILEYEKNENSITRDDQCFLLRCAADVIDNR